MGAAGSGMSALAQFHVLGGGIATGSDRSFDRGQAAGLRARLEALGVRLCPQDGSALELGPDAVIASTAIEDDNPDLRRARAGGVEVIHRADWLARYVADHRSIAVAGTSGKSTATAMLWEILEAAGKAPSVITGGALLALEGRGLVGNAWRGKSDLLVIEADESDGTLVRYAPWLGVLLNVDKDHKEVPELLEMFRSFRGRCGAFVSHAGSPNLAEFEAGARTFGIEAGAVRALAVESTAAGSRFEIDGTRFFLPLPGRHNVENALAAVAAAVEAGVDLPAAAKALAVYQGVARRFQSLGEARGVTVIDDFAHNPVKVKAAIEAARLGGRRVLGVFQPHGYAPTRFNKAEFIAAFIAALAPGDVLWLPEIYYAGGTAQKTISSKDLTDAAAAGGRDCRFEADRARLPALIADEAKAGDVVLIMGARDPSLSDFARSVLSALGPTRA